MPDVIRQAKQKDVVSVNAILKIVLLSSFGYFAGCDAGRPPARPVPPHPSESPTFKALDMREMVESAVPKDLAWQGPVAGGSGEGTSAGEGKWHAESLFMIHGTDESVDLFLRAFRDDLLDKIELSGAQSNEPNESSNESGRDAIEIGYSIGKHQGTILAGIEPAPKDVHKLVPDGRIPTHQLTIEVSEVFQPGNE